MTSCILILISFYGYSQEITVGDSTMIKEIQRKCSKIYDTKDSTIFLLTKTTFFKNAESGTRINVDYDEDSPKGLIRNFKNIPYWESRFYINNNKLVAHRHSGRKGMRIDYKAQIEIDNSKDIFEFVKKQTSLK